MTTSRASTTVNEKPVRAGWPTKRMPSIEIMTMMPAKSTDRPAVDIAVTVARLGSSPRARPLR